MESTAARRARGRTLLVACLATTIATLGLGSAVAASRAASGSQLVTITIPDRRGELPSKWLSYPGPPRANVLLPDGYNSGQSYPLLVLLPGFSNTYAVGNPSELDIQRVLAGLQAIVVAPEGGSGWYADWWNNGAYGTPEWESYILDEVIPEILQRYKILPQRRYHAVFGVSMGGLGAAYLGGRLPGFFGSIGILSGFVDLQVAPEIVSLGMDLVTSVPPGSIVGPEDGFYATGHNPARLTANLRDTRLFMSSGDGIPTAGDGTGGGVGNAEEAAVIRPMSDAYASVLREAGIDFVYHTHLGCHCWPDFQAELRDAIEWGPFNAVVEQPAQWENDTVATHGQLWDIAYRFDRPPSKVVHFAQVGRSLSIGAAGSGVTITTSTGCSIHTATPAIIDLPNRSCS